MHKEIDDKRIIDSCAECLYDKQRHLTQDREYLAQVRKMLEERGKEDTAPYMVYLFRQLYEQRFGKGPVYAQIKKKYNDLVLGMEETLRRKIRQAQDPLKKAFGYSRIGNYIDFGAMNDVDENTFLALLENGGMTDRDQEAWQSFLVQLAGAKQFLLIADNCGEIVLDKLFLECIRERFPELKMTVMVRGAEALNDATAEDAGYVGLEQVAGIVTNGCAVTGTIFSMLPDSAKTAMKNADIILAKGQGNYESLSGQGFHIFYSFLCKCERFTERFQVQKLAGIFVEERE